MNHLQYYTIHVGEYDRERNGIDANANKRRVDPFPSSKGGRIGRRRWFNLTIENVRPSGSGGYTCVAQNEGGMAEGNVTVVYSETVEHYRCVQDFGMERLCYVASCSGRKLGGEIHAT